MKPAFRASRLDSLAQFFGFGCARGSYGRKAAESERNAEHRGIDAHYNQQRVHDRFAARDLTMIRRKLVSPISVFTQEGQRVKRKYDLSIRAA